MVYKEEEGVQKLLQVGRFAHDNLKHVTSFSLSPVYMSRLDRDEARAFYILHTLPNRIPNTHQLELSKGHSDM